MTFWRDAVDLKIPVHDDFKVNFMGRRGPLLDGFIKTGSDFLIFLRSCKAEGDDLVELDALKTEVEYLKKWAENGLKELRAMASEETRKDQSPE